MRKIQSFVRRSGRLTPSQQNALTNLWGEFALNGPYDFNNIWTNSSPIILEIGFGNGDSLLQIASDNQNNNYLGIEVYEAGIGRLINNANKLGLKNLKVIKADAVEVLKLMPDNYLSGLQLFFPDPWHKKKHHKRRIVQSGFLDLISKKMNKNSVLHIATDWQNYAQHMLETLESHPDFKNTVASGYALKPNKRPLTKFELRGRKLGHKIWDLVFTRR